MRTRVTERGQVTIPKPLRERLGINPGEVLDFEDGGEGTLIARKVLERDAIDAAYGTLDLGAPTDDLIRELRGEPDAH